MPGISQGKRANAVIYALGIQRRATQGLKNENKRKKKKKEVGRGRRGFKRSKADIKTAQQCQPAIRERPQGLPIF